MEAYWLVAVYIFKEHISIQSSRNTQMLKHQKKKSSVNQKSSAVNKEWHLLYLSLDLPCLWFSLEKRRLSSSLSVWWGSSANSHNVFQNWPLQLCKGVNMLHPYKTNARIELVLYKITHLTGFIIDVLKEDSWACWRDCNCY